MSLKRRALQTWFVVAQVFRYGMRTRRIGLVLVIFGGVLALVLAAIAQAVAPVVIYPLL